jgi:hypothetical protein
LLLLIVSISQPLQSCACLTCCLFFRLSSCLQARFPSVMQAPPGISCVSSHFLSVMASDRPRRMSLPVILFLRSGGKCLHLVSRSVAHLYRLFSHSIARHYRFFDDRIHFHVVALPYHRNSLVHGPQVCCRFYHAQNCGAVI